MWKRFKWSTRLEENEWMKRNYEPEVVNEALCEFYSQHHQEKLYWNRNEWIKSGKKTNKRNWCTQIKSTQMSLRYITAVSQNSKFRTDEKSMSRKWFENSVKTCISEYDYRGAEGTTDCRVHWKRSDGKGIYKYNLHVPVS